MFSPSEIKWVKNVRRDEGRDWAYFEEGTEKVFRLNFSEVQKKGAGKIMPGEIILLFQRVDQVPGVPKQTYLTHLVTPVDTILRENPELDHRFKWERKVAVIARATPMTSIFTNADKLNFKRAQFGKVCSVKLLSYTKEISEIQNEVWKLFTGHFNPDIEETITELNPEIVNDEDDFSVMEGWDIESLRYHKAKERNKVIVGIAKQRAMKKGNGKILCECCQFDFIETYGVLGTGFIECHHSLHISTGGERRTEINDLHMVCANCHRMLHRKLENGKYHSVQSLRSVLEKFRPIKTNSH